MRHSAGLLVLPALVGAAVLAAAAAAAAPRLAHTVAGDTAAVRTLLTAADLGKGWTATPPVASRLTLSCKGWSPSGSGIVETGGAGLPSLSAGPSGPVITQNTSIYATAAQASTLWRRAVQPGLLACVRESLDAVSAHGIKVKILSQGMLPLAKAGPLTAGYRVVADLRSARNTLKTYFDVVLVGNGDALSEMTFSSFVSPVPAQVEHALALFVYRNMARR